MTDDDLSDWERDLAERLFNYVTAPGVHKQLLALSVALGVGIWLGVNATAQLVTTSHPPAVDPDHFDWIPQAEALVWAGIVLMAVGAIGWIWLDWMEGRDD